MTLALHKLLLYLLNICWLTNFQKYPSAGCPVISQYVYSPKKATNLFGLVLSTKVSRP